jgi:hypothetical protein
MKHVLIALILSVANFSYSQSQNCNCPPNNFGLSNVKADTVFHLSNGKSIALCGSREVNLAKNRLFFQEFVLSVCGEKKIIKFWDAVLVCQLRIKKDTLIVETLDSLPTGKNMQYKWTVWTIERIYFKNNKTVKDFGVNRQIPQYSAQEIQSALKQYERAVKKDEATNNPNRVNNVNMEIADKLFISAISGSKQAATYLKAFKNHFGGLSGEYLEWWVDLMRKLKLWNTNVETNEDFLQN